MCKTALTTLQFMMNAKLSQQRFRNCTRKEWLIKTIVHYNDTHYPQPICQFQVLFPSLRIITNQDQNPKGSRLETYELYGVSFEFSWQTSFLGSVKTLELHKNEPAHPKYSNDTPQPIYEFQVSFTLLSIRINHGSAESTVKESQLVTRI